MASPLATLAMIFGTAAVAGGVVSLPLLFLVRRSRKHGLIARSAVLTRSGKQLSIVLVAVVMAVFGWRYLAAGVPGWLATWWGPMVVALLLWSLSIPVDRLLARRGYPTVRPRHRSIDGPSESDGSR